MKFLNVKKKLLTNENNIKKLEIKKINSKEIFNNIY